MSSKAKVVLLRLDYRSFPVPPPYMPLGILYIASVLEKNNFEVSVVDLNLDTETFFWAEVANADIIGISMLSYVRSQGYRIIKKLKKIYPNKKIILGGAFASSLSELLLKAFPIDALVNGEGEYAFLHLCNEWRNGNIIEKKVYKFPLADINKIPFPAWHHTQFEAWDMQIAKSRPDWRINGVLLGEAKWSPIIASRGCFGRCTFCNAFKNWDYKLRFRSAKNIVDEIETLVTKYDVKLFSFDDNAFPVNKKQCIEFCNELKKRNLRIAWKADTRIDGLDKEMLSKMKEAGCFMLAVGIESGSPTILKNIKKGINVEKAKQTIKLIKEVGIIAYTLLMVGNPGENDETIQETINFLQECKPNIYSNVSGVMILPDTEMQKLAKIPDEYYLKGDGLPFYTAENSRKQLDELSNKLHTVSKNY